MRRLVNGFGIFFILFFGLLLALPGLVIMASLVYGVLSTLFA